MKKILFILRKPPHSGAYLQEALDFILTTAAFDQDVSLLLLDTAVFQIKAQQKIDQTGLKDTLAIYSVLPLYNIKQIYAESESLQESGLSVPQLNTKVIKVLRKNVNVLFKQFDLVLSA